MFSEKRPADAGLDDDNGTMGERATAQCKRDGLVAETITAWCGLSPDEKPELPAEDLAALDRRRSPRWRSRVPARVIVKGLAMDAEVVDIGRDGMRLEITLGKWLEERTRGPVVVRVRVPRTNIVVELTARIRHVDRVHNLCGMKLESRGVPLLGRPPSRVPPHPSGSG